jgi:hypothetical protein
LWELQLTADALHGTFANAANRPDLREDLSLVAFLLNREHEEVVKRVRELFGKRARPADLEPLERAFQALNGETMPRKLVALQASIEARMILTAEASQRFDSHTRLMFRVLACSTKGLILPTLKNLLPTGSDHADLSGATSMLVNEYRAFLPGKRGHTDAFLEHLFSHEPS